MKYNKTLFYGLAWTFISILHGVTFGWEAGVIMGIATLMIVILSAHRDELIYLLPKVTNDTNKVERRIKNGKTKRKKVKVQ